MTRADVDVDAVAQATAALYRELEEAWNNADAQREEAMRAVHRWQDAQGEIEMRVRQCYDTAQLFGFDLQTILMRDRQQPRVPMEVALPPPQPKRIPTVKEYVLDAARKASPNRVRAAEIRKSIYDDFQIELHEKTVGMTLYRLMKDGWVTRSGADWFFNTNRGLTAADLYETPGEDDPPDDEWLREIAG